MTTWRLERADASSATALSIRGLWKSLGGLEVLRGVDVDIRPGEVHALMGGNGAGKSTLIKCLSGYWKPDSGTITVAGQPFESGTRQVAVVQQDLGLIPTLSVAENIALSTGFQTGRLGSIRWRRQFAHAGGLLEAVGHPDIDPKMEVRLLDSVQRTTVAIARAVADLQDGVKVLILDEPTAALPFDEVNRLFDILDRLKDSGVGMLYVSHHLSEVMRVSDRISVLRGGNISFTSATSETDEETVVIEMLGRSVERMRRDAGIPVNAAPSVVLALNDVKAERLQGVTMDVRAGEILGVAGLQGSGCTELLLTMFGAVPASGSMTYLGSPYAPSTPTQAVAAGISLLTEDRHVDGSFPDLPVIENLSVTDVQRYARRGWVRRRLEKREATQLIEKFDIVPPDPYRRFSTLSGGNQQKVVLAKWLRMNPKVLLLDQPDLGVDVGARAEIYRAVKQASAAGTAVVLVSNQFDDLAALCDRVLILHSGRIVDELVGVRLNEHEISLVVAGDLTTTGAEEVNP